MGNGYLKFDIKIRKADNTNFIVADDNTNEIIGSVNKVFAYTLNDARISTSCGVEMEQNNYLGPISTIMRLVTQKDGDISTYFDRIDENETGINSSSLQQLLINNHIEDNQMMKCQRDNQINYIRRVLLSVLVAEDLLHYHRD